MELDIKQRISFRPFTGDFPPIKPRHVERQTKKAEEAASSGSLFARVFEEVLEANLVDACSAVSLQRIRERKVELTSNFLCRTAWVLLPYDDHWHTWRPTHHVGQISPISRCFVQVARGVSQQRRYSESIIVHGEVGLLPLDRIDLFGFQPQPAQFHRTCQPLVPWLDFVKISWLCC